MKKLRKTYPISLLLLFSMFCLTSETTLAQQSFSPERNLFNIHPVLPAQFMENDSNNMYLIGMQHADRYYVDYSPFAGGFLGGMLLPPAGLVSTIIISSHRPKPERLMIPEIEDYNNKPAYLEGYQAQAFKRKRQRAWSGFLTGTSFFVAGMLMFGYLEWR